MSIIQTRLQVTHMDIVGTMKSTYEVFKNDGQEVRPSLFLLNPPLSIKKTS